MPETLVRPLARLLYVLLAVAVVYGCNLAYGIYATYQARQGDIAILTAQRNQAIQQYNQLVAQIQTAQQGQQTP